MVAVRRAVEEDEDSPKRPLVAAGEEDVALGAKAAWLGANDVTVNAVAAMNAAATA